MSLCVCLLPGHERKGREKEKQKRKMLKIDNQGWVDRLAGWRAALNKFTGNSNATGS